MTAKLVNEGRLQILTDYLTARASNIRVGLFTAPSSVSVSTNFAGLTLATFSGYAAVTPTLGAPSIDGNGNALSAGSTATFTHNGGGTSNVIVGYAVYDTGASKLLFAEMLPAPVTLSANGQFISVTPNLYAGEVTPPL